MGPTPVMPWGGSPATPPPLAGHPGQSTSTLPPPSAQGYWLLMWVPPAGSPTVGNASVDDTDAATIVTFFFATDGKTFVPTFNCYLRNTCQCQMTRLLIHLSSSNLLCRPNATSSMRFSMWEDPVRAIAVAPATTQCRDELCYM
jgi:hypothetical protein